MNQPVTPAVIPDMPKLPAPGSIPSATREQVGQAYKDQEWASPFASDSFGYQLGAKAMNMLKGPNFWSRTFDHGPALGAASGAATLGGLGYLGAKAFNWLGPQRKMDPARMAMLTGLVGALFGGTRGHYQTKYKSAAFQNLGLGQLIEQASLSPDTEQALLQALTTMSPAEVQQLAGILRTFTGAMAGAAVSRMLFGRSPISSILGLVGGGYAGNSLLGSKHISNVRDIY